MPLVARPFRGLYAGLFALFLVFGTSLTMVGAALPRILSDFGWDYRQAGLVIAAGAIAFFASTYAAGALVARLGPRLAIALGLGACAAALAFFGAGRAVAPNVAFYALVGLGQGFIEVGVNWCVLAMGDRAPPGAGTAEGGLEPAGSGGAMSLMHGAFAIGAVVGPALVGAFLGAGLPWLLVFRGTAGAYLAGLVLCLVLPFRLLGAAGRAAGKPSPRGESAPAAPDAAEAAGAPAGGAGGPRAAGPRPLLLEPVYLLGFAALFLYVGVELGISNWAAEYFVRAFGGAEALASLTVSLFWAGLVAGRLGIPVLLPRVRQGRLLAVLAAALAAAAILLAAAGRLGPAGMPLALAAVAAAGLGASCVYPVAVSLVGEALPARRGEAIGFASTGGGVGAFLFPFLMSRIAAGAGVAAGFAFYAAVGVLAAAACAALARATAAAAR